MFLCKSVAHKGDFQSANDALKKHIHTIIELDTICTINKICLFQAVRELIPNGNPEYFSSDFELAAINSYLTVFPQTKIAGCLTFNEKP